MRSPLPSDSDRPARTLAGRRDGAARRWLGYARWALARPLAGRAAISALILVALALRLWRVSTSSLRGDEAFSVLFAERGLPELLGQLRLVEPHPPLYYAGLHLWLLVAGESELAVRLPSIVFGTLMVPLVYALARSATPAAPALLASLLVAVNPFLLWHSQDARMYTLLPALAVASLLFTIRLLTRAQEASDGSEDTRGPASVSFASAGRTRGLRATRLGQGDLAARWVTRVRRIRRDWLGLVLANVLMMHAHYAGVYALLAENVAAAYVMARALIANRRRTRMRKSTLSATQARAGDDSTPGGGKGEQGMTDTPERRVAAQGAHLPAWPSTSGLVVGWVSSQVATIVLCLPWWLYAREVLLRRTISWLEPPSLPALLHQAWTAYSLGTILGPEVTSPLAVAFLPPLALGLACWLKRPSGHALTLCLVVPLLGAYLMSLRRPVYLDRYFIFVVPVYALALGSGLAVLRRRSRPLFAANLLALLAASAYVLAGYYLDPRLAKSPDWRGAGDLVVARHQPRDLLILNSPDPTLAYYVRQPGSGPAVPHRTLPERGPPDRAATHAALAEAIRDYSRIWLAPIRDPSWDAEGFVEEWLDAYAHPLAEERFRGLRLRLYATPGALLAAHPRPTPLSFGGQIEYLGYDLSRDGSPGSPIPPTLRSGEDLWLTLYFRATRPVDGDYRVFNHLLDETDRLRGQHDGPPVFGRQPTSTWRVGELVMDRHRIPVASDSPTGRYRLRTGYYDPVSGRRLAVTDGSGRILGDAVTVEGIEVTSR